MNARRAVQHGPMGPSPPTVTSVPGPAMPS
jgi:hypothetical protein